MSKSIISKDSLSSGIASLIKKALPALQKDGTISYSGPDSMLPVSYVKHIYDDYILIVIDEAIVDTSYRMRWYLMHMPSETILDSGKKAISHNLTLIRSATGDVIAKTRKDILDEATKKVEMEREIEKMLTEDTCE